MEIKEIKLYDSELKVMDILWEHGEITAKKIAEILTKQAGWSKTTTYTVLKKCVDKGAVKRIEPNFICRPLITREQTREYETTELINKMYGGSADRLVASILGRKNLTSDEIERLKKIVGDLKS